MTELIAHPWPPHPKEYWWYCFHFDGPIDYAIKTYKRFFGKLPEFVILTEKRWRRESWQASPDSLYYLYNGVKITWHPESLGLMRLGPKGKR